MGAGDLSGFRVTGRTLSSLGLVKASEGNLSTWDGERLSITRTGSRLSELGPSEVLEGTLDDPPDDASSDLAIHLRLYRDHGPGAVGHAHPQGSVPEGWVEGEPHGSYAFAGSLERAVATLVDRGSLEGAAIRPVGWREGSLTILDQRELPFREEYVELRTVDEVAGAIGALAVRGAPLLGITAAYGIALAVAVSTALTPQALSTELERAARTLAATRPTAVSIGWAVGRMMAVAAGPAGDAPGRLREETLAEARRIEEEDREACAAMGALGAEFVPDGANVLTHCNTGMLCTAGIGTALGVVVAAHRAGKRIHVWVDETRPMLQGARLTAWELMRLGVPMTLIADGAAGSLMAAGKVDLVVVGADRIAANGDVANKVGTYPLAVLARHHGIPLYVVAPVSTIDPSTASGAEIAIEERDPSEVTAPMGHRIATRGTRAANPAFDVTPSSLVTAIVTERGVIEGPTRAMLRELCPGRRSA